MRIPKAHIIQAGDASGDIVGQPTSLFGMWLASYQFVWTGTPTGVLSLEVSNNYDESRKTGDWETVDLDPAIVQPAGAAGKQVAALSDLPFGWIRPRYTATSGAGTLDAWITAKGP